MIVPEKELKEKLRKCTVEQLEVIANYLLSFLNPEIARRIVESAIEIPVMKSAEEEKEWWSDYEAHLKAKGFIKVPPEEWKPPKYISDNPVPPSLYLSVQSREYSECDSTKAAKAEEQHS
jgi:hypothetical protein